MLGRRHWWRAPWQSQHRANQPIVCQCRDQTNHFGETNHVWNWNYVNLCEYILCIDLCIFHLSNVSLSLRACHVCNMTIHRCNQVYQSVYLIALSSILMYMIYSIRKHQQEFGGVKVISIFPLATPRPVRQGSPPSAGDVGGWCLGPSTAASDGSSPLRRRSMGHSKTEIGPQQGPPTPAVDHFSSFFRIPKSHQLMRIACWWS